MAPTLYATIASPPVRAVLLTAKSIGLNLDFKEVDLSKNEHKTPEFLELNPQHTVPTLVDEDGFTIWDSHAIIPYLLEKYGKDDSMYPKDPKKRAIVDQRLHFDSGVAWARLLQILRPIIYDGKKTIDLEHIDATNEIYAFVETFLEGKQWIAGDHVTIADYSLITTLTASDIVVKIDPSKYPKLTAWIEKVESLPVYEASRSGQEALKAYLKSFLG